MTDLLTRTMHQSSSSVAVKQRDPRVLILSSGLLHHHHLEEGMIFLVPHPTPPLHNHSVVTTEKM